MDTASYVSIRTVGSQTGFQVVSEAQERRVSIAFYLLWRKYLRKKLKGGKFILAQILSIGSNSFHLRNKREFMKRPVQDIVLMDMLVSCFFWLGPTSYLSVPPNNAVL